MKIIKYLLTLFMVITGCDKSNNVRELSDRVTKLENDVKSLTEAVELIVEFQNGVLRYEEQQNDWNRQMKLNVDILIGITEQTMSEVSKMKSKKYIFMR